MPARLRRGRTSEELSLPSPSEELLRRRFGEAGFAVLSFRDGWSSTRRLADVAGTDQRAGGRGSPLQSAVPWEQRWFYSVALLVLLPARHASPSCPFATPGAAHGDLPTWQARTSVRVGVGHPCNQLYLGSNAGFTPWRCWYYFAFKRKQRFPGFLFLGSRSVRLLLLYFTR